MTAMFIPLTHGTTLDDLCFSQKIWEESPINHDGVEDSRPRPHPPPNTEYIFSCLIESAPHIHSVIKWLWFIKYKLVEEYTPEFCKQLFIPIEEHIPIEKSIKHPTIAMNINSSTTQ